MEIFGVMNKEVIYCSNIYRNMLSVTGHIWDTVCRLQFDCFLRMNVYSVRRITPEDGVHDNNGTSDLMSYTSSYME